MYRRRNCRTSEPVAVEVPARSTARIQRERNLGAATAWALETGPFSDAVTFDDQELANSNFRYVRVSIDRPSEKIEAKQVK